MVRWSFRYEMRNDRWPPESIHLFPVMAVSPVKTQGVLCIIQKNNLLKL